jgi:AraC-like DNA-binding protein
MLPLLENAALRGVDVAAVARDLQLPETILQPNYRISLAAYFRLQNEISAALQDETMQMSKRQLLPGTTDFILAGLAGVGSLLDAMRLLARSYNLLHGGEFNSVRRKGDIVSFIIDDRRFPYVSKDNPGFLRFSLECVQIFLHCILALVSRPHANAGLRRVSVTRPVRGEDAIHLDFWSAPIRFGAPVYMLDYDYGAATAAIAPPGVETLNAASVHAEIAAASAAPSRNSGRATADFVRQQLARGMIDQTRIAALVGVSVATLRRRLEEEGARFRDLRQEVLNEAAKVALRRQTPITQVAEELGFSDLRAFNRAFKSWNGVTPKGFVEAGRTRTN